jgi:hypothetical protein
MEKMIQCWCQLMVRHIFSLQTARSSSQILRIFSNILSKKQVWPYISLEDRNFILSWFQFLPDCSYFWETVNHSVKVNFYRNWSLEVIDWWNCLNLKAVLRIKNYFHDGQTERAAFKRCGNRNLVRLTWKNF